MAPVQISPYGSWKSPITSDLVASGSITLGQVVLDGQDVYWTEMRPAEGGRNVIVKRTPDGRVADLTPAPFNARTLVHEYGGGAFTVSRGVVFFSNFDDQRLYRQEPGQEPRTFTSAAEFRYADGVVDSARGRMICVQEDHTGSGEAVNSLVALPLHGGQSSSVLVAGADFYSSPRLSPDGRTLAWLSWDHPNMPWDGTELWIAGVDSDGSLGQPSLVAGGKKESIFQPEWSPDNVLYFVSDRTGWWNLYRRRDGVIEPLVQMDAEFGRPQWVFASGTYGFESAQRMVCAYQQNGSWSLATLDTASGKLEPVNTGYTAMGRGDLKVAHGKAFFIAGSPTEPMSLLQLDLASGAIQVLRSSGDLEVDSGYLSVPEAVQFPTEDGMMAHGIYYPPHNRDYAASSQERPPLLVKSHGGPTDAASTALDLKIQYWTSRGFAVLDVNYGGSTGYGREYRERLKGRWGIVDVDDCVNGARYLVQRGLADGDRLAIDGGSAGGYTTLAALTFRDVFKAGASLYGVSDLEALAKDTHKFESRYLDGLIGPYPERRDLYLERSPIHHTQQLSCPLILFQGLDDKIVPPDQAEAMFEAVRAKGLPTAYLAFPGEQHGFRRAENIKRVLEAELYFYSKVFGFQLADPIEPVSIENLQS